MKTLTSKPLFWRLETLLSLGTDHVHDLARRAAGSLTSFRLLLGRCLLALQENQGYKTFGCSSSAHYAVQILGVGKREASECRRVARQLQPLPDLTIAAEQGRIEWSHLREIVRKASPETESYWLALSEKFNADQIQKLARQTPWGAVPGEAFEDEEHATTELRCPLNPRVFRMLAQARRIYSIEQNEAVTSADVVELALATYIAGRAVDTDVLEKARDEADKDLQAEDARRLPLVYQARELAEDMGLLGDDSGEQQDEDTCQQEPIDDCELLTRALGSLPPGHQSQENNLLEREQQSSSQGLTWVAPQTSKHSKPPSGLRLQGPWINPRVRFNLKKRLATKAQRREILRRDGWCCNAPGCSHKIFLHLHHLKSYAEGGETKAENLLSLCSGCHRNLHNGDLRISQDAQGKLVFFDSHGRRLDRQCNLEMAAWLDWWHGWKGREIDSHSAKASQGNWEVAV